MGRFLQRLRLVALVALVVTAAAAVFSAGALASDPASGADASQLLDVSKQVQDIQRKLADLTANGRSATEGALLRGADCGFAASSQRFLPWGDDAEYALIPEGDLSTAAHWTLNKAASVMPGGDPATGAAQSLQLAAGGQAATPAICVDVDHPSARFFVRDLNGRGKSDLKVEVLYDDPSGKAQHLTVAKLRPGSDWQPSPIIPIYMNMIAAATPSGLTAVAFKFSAEGLEKNEAYSLSSVYVDPFKGR